jgi:hypothetical protein
MAEDSEHDAKLREHDEWVQAIGRFIVSFAECEYWTYRYIAELLPPRVSAVVSQQMLESRGKVAKAAIEDAQLGISDERLKDVFERLADLAAFRNIVAHNPPMFAIYQAVDDPEEVKVVVEMVNSRNPNKQPSLARLQERHKEAQELCRLMSNLHSEIGAAIRKK